METFLYRYSIFFAGIIVVAVVVKLLMKVMGNYEITPLNVQREEALAIPFLAITIIGAYGYFEQVSIINQMFWQVYSILLIALTVAAFWFPKLQWLKKEVSLRAYVVITVVSIMINLPMYYIVLMYAFSGYPEVIHG
jgi:hypothetical protein